MAFKLQDEQDAIKDAIKRVSTESSRQRFQAELAHLSAQHAATSADEQRAVENRITQLHRDVEIAAGVNLWSWASILLVLAVVMLYFGGIYMYMGGLGADRYSSIEATRPILVFTLIVAMLGFGGLLIVRALFTRETDDEFQKRFRHAREIFLVFAGIFGTIIGFYFGAADQQAAAPPSLSAPVFADGRISVEIEGGHAPFISMLTIGDAAAAQVIQGDARSVRFDAPDGCPADAAIIVVDGQGRRDEADLACPAADSGADGNASENVAENVAG